MTRMKNEAPVNPAASAPSAVRVREKRAADRRRGFISKCRQMVHHANRKVEATEIKWNYDLEVYECVKCHSIMYYDFRFRVCPFCERRIVHTDERRF